MFGALEWDKLVPGFVLGGLVACCEATDSPEIYGQDAACLSFICEDGVIEIDKVKFI